MWRLLAILLILTAPATALAASSAQSLSRQYPLGTLISAKALNAAAATRTATITLTGDKKGYDLLYLHIDYTNSSATAVTMTCYSTPSASDSAATMQDCNISSGLCTSADAGWSNAVSGDEVWPWRVDISGMPGEVTCVLAGTGAGAGDLVTVKGWLTTL